MSKRLSELIDPLIASITLLSPTRYHLEGCDDVDIAATAPASREDPFFHADPFILHLHRDIYRRFHAGIDTFPTNAPMAATETDEFITALKEANACPEYWDDHWTVLDKLSDGSLIAEKSHRICRWMPGQYRYDGAPQLPKRKDTVSVLHLSHSLLIQPGYFYAMGSWISDDVEQLGGLRVYFNVDATHAVPLLALITSEMEKRGIPFRFKCPSDPHHYGRIDTAVLYIAARYGQLVLSVLENLYPRLSMWLRASTPLLALRIADGIAMAEEPADGNSFGAGRALAVAEGLKKAFSADLMSIDERRDAVLQAFCEHGYSLDDPHLMASTHDAHGLRQLQPFSR